MIERLGSDNLHVPKINHIVCRSQQLTKSIQEVRVRRLFQT